MRCCGAEGLEKSCRRAAARMRGTVLDKKERNKGCQTCQAKVARIWLLHEARNLDEGPVCRRHQGEWPFGPREQVGHRDERGQETPCAEKDV